MDLRIHKKKTVKKKTCQIITKLPTEKKKNIRKNPLSLQPILQSKLIFFSFFHNALLLQLDCQLVSVSQVKEQLIIKGFRGRSHCTHSSTFSLCPGELPSEPSYQPSTTFPLALYSFKPPRLFVFLLWSSITKIEDYALISCFCILFYFNFFPEGFIHKFLLS